MVRSSCLGVPAGESSGRREMGQSVSIVSRGGQSGGTYCAIESCCVMREPADMHALLLVRRPANCRANAAAQLNGRSQWRDNASGDNITTTTLTAAAAAPTTEKSSIRSTKFAIDHRTELCQERIRIFLNLASKSQK